MASSPSAHQRQVSKAADRREVVVLEELLEALVLMLVVVSVLSFVMSLGRTGMAHCSDPRLY